MNVTLFKGGTKEKTLPVDEVKIPDLWHSAMLLPDGPDRQMVLECWHMADDLLRELRQLAAAQTELLNSVRAIVSHTEIDADEFDLAMEALSNIRSEAGMALAKTRFEPQPADSNR